jgi:hypothetical protein
MKSSVITLNGLLLNLETKNMHEDDNDSYAIAKNDFSRLFSHVPDTHA